MSIEVCLHDLTKRVRDLLECSGVSLLLYCPDLVLRHSLLTLFLMTYGERAIKCYGSAMASELLHDERVSALCDMVIQTGLIWRIDHIKLHGQGCSMATGSLDSRHTMTGSIVVAPLERPAGMLGLLLFIDTRPAAFQRGEWRLIEQYLPTLARWLEQALAGACSTHSTCRSLLPENVESSAVSLMQEQCEFISIVSHELRLPLTVIKGYTALLQAYGFSCEKNEQEECGIREKAEITAARQQQYLDVIMQQVNHLEVLIGDLLDISRAQAGRLTLRCKKTNLARICHDVARTVQDRIELQQTERYIISCTIEPDLPLVWADPDRVQQVLANLLENAVKYSPEGGLIEILAYMPHSPCDPPMAYVTVRDQGIGIPLLQQSVLFKPFMRLEHQATANVAGIGLGLYISRKLIEAMDGRVMLDSREGEGTSVTFTLPIEPLDKTHTLRGSSEKSFV